MVPSVLLISKKLSDVSVQHLMTLRLKLRESLHDRFKGIFAYVDVYEEVESQVGLNNITFLNMEPYFEYGTILL